MTICFSGCRSTLYRPGSRSSSSAARSKRDIIASKGFSSFRKRSLSGRTIRSVGSLRSVVMRCETGRLAGGGGRSGARTYKLVEDVFQPSNAALHHHLLRNIPQRPLKGAWGTGLRAGPARTELYGILERADNVIEGGRL